MAKNGASAAKKTNTAENTLPLFFKAPTPIDSARHAAAGLTPSDDLSFTRTTNSLSINAVEFVEAAKYYPIVFTQGETVMPAALVGLEQENYFVDEQNRWAANFYLPAYVRKYPFIFMEVPEESQFVLCVDEGAPQFKQVAGEGDLKMFDGDKPTALIDSAL
ncbi:MAG: SapC family protein, partial [Alphaproteobacteria bacterium]|nr:SapC family protein [Alphaproteobacteria bacterium]